MRVDDIVTAFKRLIRPLKQKVLLMIVQGLVESTKDDGNLQLVQATFLADETKNDVRKMHHFGFSSHAPVGSECISVSVGGNRESTVIIATENRTYRFKDLGEGEVVIYSQSGDYIHLKNGNAIDIKTGTLNIEADEVNIDAPSINLTGDVEIDGGQIVTGDVEIQGALDVTLAIASLLSIEAPMVTASTTMETPVLIIGGSDFTTHTHGYLDNNAVTDIPRESFGVTP